MGFLSALADPLLALKFPGITGGITPPASVPTGGLFSSGQNVIRAGITFFLIIVVLLALFYLLIGALRYIYSRGDKQRIQGAREKITYSIVGLIIAFLAFALMTIISQFFKVPLLSPFSISAEHNCGSCTTLDAVTVTVRAINTERPIEAVWIFVDFDGDDNAGNDSGESKRCTSATCSWNIGTRPIGTFQYYGRAVLANGDTLDSTKQTFTITSPSCNMITTCGNCLAKSGCMWAKSDVLPLGCYTIESGNECPVEYTVKHISDCRPQGNICTFTPPACSGTCRRDEDGCVAPEIISNAACSQASEICCVVPTPTPTNSPPLVNAGPDRVANFVLPGITISQNSNISDDCKPNSNISYVWNKLSGPGTVGFSNKTGSASCTDNFSAADTNITFTSAGTYVLELQVSDSILTAVDIAKFTLNVSSLTPTTSPPTPTPSPTSTPGGCSGNAVATVSPNPANPGQGVSATISGLNNCGGRSVFFRLGGCDIINTFFGSCAIGAIGTGCADDAGPPWAPSASTDIYACVDINLDGDFRDSGESGFRLLNINGAPIPTSTPPIPPTSTPSPTPPPPTPTPTPVNLPDFRIWFLDFTPKNPVQGEDITLEVQVQNIGNIISPATTVRFYKGGTEPRCNQPGFAELQISPLQKDWINPIEERFVTITSGFPSPGTYQIWVIVDGKCEIDEIDNSNNTWSIFITVQP